MPDMEKAIKGLGECVGDGYCTKCQYGEGRQVLSCRDLLNDALTLLKEQEAVKPVRDEQTGRLWLCGNCGSYVGFEDNDPYDPNEYDKYCRKCGRSVKWE